jgi:hypothetical protein
MSRSRALLAALTLVAAATMSAARPAPVQAQGRGDVEICHHAGPTKVITLHVSPSGAAAHIANHGDEPFACGGGLPS